jgi:tetratricopeptide (TPR) repeat protein/predicted Ser/Thr protein kinase
MSTKLGKYEIQAVLGQGAMGVVYRAWDPALKRLVALKTMVGDFKDNPDLLKRFYREAQSAGGLRHFNIVTIYDLGVENNQPYIAMEYLEGADLQSLIQKGKLLTLNQVVHIMSQCCDGLHYAHSRGIVHRDVKPANIFVLEDGSVKVVDFGIAQVASSTMTRTGMVMGTVTYMSPEQVQGKEMDGRSDQFSLGIILYEMLTRQKPFQGDSIPQIFYQILNQQPAPVKQFYTHCPPLLEIILNRSLEKNRDQRYPELSQMSKDLQNVAGALKRVYTLNEPVTLDAGSGTQIVEDSLAGVQALIDRGDLAAAGTRLEEIRRQWGDSDKVLAARVQAMQGRVRFLANRVAVQRHLEVIDALARDEKFEQAEGLLDRLDKEYPGTEEVFQIRQSIAEARRRKEKLHFIRSTISKARISLEAGDFDEALRTLEQGLHVYPEEKSLLEFYRRTVERRDTAGRRDFIRSTCAGVSTLLKEGHTSQAIRTVEQALERFPDEDVFQNLYKTLIARKHPPR